LGGRVKVKSRRELRDKIFAKLRKTNVKIIAKKAKNRKKKKILLEKHKNKLFWRCCVDLKSRHQIMVAHP
jgi:DNA polymerase elongation subunit (family B)